MNTADRATRLMKGAAKVMAFPERLTLAVKAMAEDSYEVARVYLAEHPADSDEPITEDWLRSVGGVPDSAGAILVSIDANNPRAIAIEPDGSVAIQEDNYDRPMNVQYIGTNAYVKTRRDLRRLCEALGVKLTEANR